ncbi:MAG TPA: protein kinase, partial [Thermoanaerobaculia bacterium]
GIVLGTIGYMSPEQVRGQAADARSDIFSFGAILYEMLSGSRAFSGGSAADTMSAILMKEPADISVTNQAVSPALERIVRHCLEKNPEERFHSAHDVAFALETLSGVSTPSGRVAALPHAQAGPRALRAAGGIVVAVTIAAGAFLLGRNAGSNPPPSFRQLTFRRGRITSARFAPDGQTFLYSAAWEGAPGQLFSGRPGTPEALSLPVPPAALMGISTSGEIAMQMTPRYVRPFTWAGTLARAPLAGGTPREILEAAQWADWAPDGKSFTVVRDSGGKNRLEFPIGKALYDTAGFVSHPRMSPRGDLVAFLDHPQQGDDAGSVAVVDLAGKMRSLTKGFSTASGLAWSPRGDEVWFSATRMGGARSLYAVSLSGRERLLARVTGSLTLHDVSRDGRVLLAHDAARLGIYALPPGEKEERDLSWLDWGVVRDISADGKTILFDESSEGGGPGYSVYIRKADGSPAVRLGEGSAAALSPDGKWALSIPRASPAQLVLLPTGSGEPRRITDDSIDHVSAGFFPDGKRIFFSGNEPGHGLRFFVQDVVGGKPKAITPEGVETFTCALSPDGKRLAVVDPDGRTLIYPLDGNPAEPINSVEAGESPLYWSRDGRSLYVRTRNPPPVRILRVDLATGARDLWKEIAPSDTSGLVGVFEVHPVPETGAYVYTYGRILSELYLAEGIR